MKIFKIIKTYEWELEKSEIVLSVRQCESIESSMFKALQKAGYKVDRRTMCFDYYQCGSKEHVIIRKKDGRHLLRLHEVDHQEYFRSFDPSVTRVR